MLAKTESSATEFSPAASAEWLGEDWASREFLELAAPAGFVLTSWETARPRVAIAPVAFETAGLQISKARKRVGSGAYLIALLDALPPAPWRERLMEIGCDDIAGLADPEGVRLSLARARKALARNKAVEDDRDQLQASIDNLPSPIFLKDRMGVYVGCNQAFLRFSGLSRSKVIGSTIRDLVPAHLADIYEAADLALMKSGGTQIYDAKAHYADGSEHDVSFQKACFHDANGEVRGMACAMLDITERVALQKQLEEAAERDPLTGAYNRRKFFATVQKMEVRAASERLPLSFVLLDIDHFKSLNDRWGHACGDMVLSRLAAMFDAAMPVDGIAARAGGEEFFAAFLGLALTDARAAAEVFRDRLGQTEFCYDGASLGVTASFGVAELRLGAETVWQAIVRCDKALYAAKAAGRDRVEIAA